MNKITTTGKTIEDAIQSALTKLNTTRSKVTYRVLEEPSKGLFGLFGVKEAKVEVTLIEELVPEEPAEEVSISEPEMDPVVEITEEEEKSHRILNEQETVEEAREFLLNVLQTMGLNAGVERLSRDGNILFNIYGEGLGLIIGRRGQTLDSLQYLVNTVANRYSEKRVRIILDAENYRAKRKDTLEQLAERIASQVKRSGKPVRLEPMNPAERKIIHTYLQGRKGISTYSEGSEPYRRIVISNQSR
jgi:spoIIIJ-associated protein